MATKGGRTPTRTSTQKQLGDIVYTTKHDFPNGLLPSRKVVIENIRYLMRPALAGQCQHSKECAALILAELLQEHWLYCNVYTINTRHIQTKVLNLYGEFTSLIQPRKDRWNEKYNEKVRLFNENSEHLFDIFCEDAVCWKRLEASNGVKMSSEEWDFLHDQRSDRKKCFVRVSSTESGQKPWKEGREIFRL